MSAYSTRVSEDLRKIEALGHSTTGKVKIKSCIGNPVHKIVIELNYPTAPSSSYPSQVQYKTEVQIDLLSSYPFKEPSAKITTPIYHPNVYSSGQICFGTKWLPTQSLDLLVQRIIKIITFDESILNEASPANGSALSWYKSAILSYRDSFPTSKLLIKEPSEKKISWNNVSSSSADRLLRSCPNCNTSLRLPAGRRGNVGCPSCSHKFFVET